MGGKRYKKGKKGGGEQTDIKMIDIDSADGQMIGRVTRVLGNRRFQVHCNDNVVRICRLCGSLRKSEWVSVGSIVLLAKRELNAPVAATPNDSVRRNNVEAFARIEEGGEDEDGDDDDEEGDDDEEIHFEKHDIDVISANTKNDKNIGDILQVVDPSLYTKLSKLPGVNKLLFVDIENSFMKTNKAVASSTEGNDFVFDGSDDESGNTGENDDSEEEGDAELTDEQRSAAKDARKAQKAAERKKKQEEFDVEGLKNRQKEAVKKRGSEREKKIKLSDL